MSADLNLLKGFDLANATLMLWTFKKSTNSNNPNTPVFTGRWVDTSENLIPPIKQAISIARDQVTEVLEYDIMAQNNEASALSIPKLETHADIIVQQAANETDNKKITKIEKIANTDFYSIKLVHNNTVIHCVRKTDDSWRTKKSVGIISALFSDEGLELEVKPSFNISKNFDFFIVNDSVLIQSKQNFESILSYKEAHIQDFSSMQADPAFAGVFSDMSHIINYVGNNKMQLRRASAIKQKGFYKNAAFIESLRQNYQAFGLNISFDQNGKIVPTPDSCADIFQALLDYRVKSHFSQNIYNVQSTVLINIP